MEVTLKDRVFRKFRNLVRNYLTAIIFVIPVIGLFSYLAISRFESTSLDPEVFKNRDFQKFEKFSRQIGPSKTYELLKNHYPNNEVDAHDFAHIIGLVAYEKEGNGGMRLCDTAYNYGCSHGFIEGFLLKKGIDAVGEIEQSCLELGLVHTPSCLHGIGHGLLINSSYQLESALTDCDRLKESSRIYCWDGAFMERVVGSMQTEQSRQKATTETLNKPCDSIAEIYKQQCWRNQVTVWFDFYKQDTQKILSQCTKIEKEYQQICFESVGLINVMNAKEDIGRLVASCAVTGDFLIDSCLIGELKELLFEGKNPQIAQSLCGYVSEQNSQSCHHLYEQLFGESQMRFSQNQNLTN